MELDFEIVHLMQGNHCVLKCEVDGKRVRMLIDSGATTTCIDKKSKCLHASTELRNGTKVTHLGGEVEVKAAVVNYFKIGTFAIGAIRMPIIDLVDVNKAYKEAGYKALDGIIGMDILKGYDCQMDFGKQTLKMTFK